MSPLDRSRLDGLPERTAARLFWRRRSLYAESIRQGHRLTVALLGFGELGEEVLTYALQNNLFDPGQCIEYHVFGGDGGAFFDTYRQLGGLEDRVVFHAEPWQERRPLIEESHAMIALAQEDQAALVGELLSGTERDGIDVFCSGESLPASDRLLLFNWRSEARRLESGVNRVLLDRAKRLNLRYVNIYQGVPETEEAREEQWQALDVFTQGSCISAADYHEVRLQMLEAMGEDPERLSPECMELLTELEHIRWCRYHYLNNWRQGTPENGRNKDAALRIHEDLILYGELSEDDKEKDRENIRILLSIK